MYSGISYSPHEYTVSELQALMHGLRDYEAAKERVANYIKTAYASRAAFPTPRPTPSVTDEGRAFDESATGCGNAESACGRKYPAHSH